MSAKKPNIFLRDVSEVISYSSEGARIERSFPVRSNPRQHADIIKKKLQECQKKAIEQKQVAAIRYKEGLYLEFSGEVNKELNVKSLENISLGVRLLNVRTEEDVTRATVYVPSSKTGYFLSKVAEYSNSLDGTGNPKNNDLIRSIEDVRLAVVESFWIGDKSFIPD